jgi:hypothetical protein
MRTLLVAAAAAMVVTSAHAAQLRTAKPGPRARTAVTLNRALAGTPMAHTGYQLERVGWRYRISPYFIAAIAATESSLGRAACRSNRYNAWGLASCGTSWRVPDFGSWAEAYMFMGRFLTGRWPHARTPYDYHGYAACTPCWGRKTAYWMGRLFGVGPSVRYP